MTLPQCVSSYIFNDEAALTLVVFVVRVKAKFIYCRLSIVYLQEGEKGN